MPANESAKLERSEREESAKFKISTAPTAKQRLQPCDQCMSEGDRCLDLFLGLLAPFAFSSPFVALCRSASVGAAAHLCNTERLQPTTAAATGNSSSERDVGVTTDPSRGATPWAEVRTESDGEEHCFSRNRVRSLVEQLELRRVLHGAVEGASVLTRALITLPLLTPLCRMLARSLALPLAPSAINGFHSITYPNGDRYQGEMRLEPVSDWDTSSALARPDSAHSLFCVRVTGMQVIGARTRLRVAASTCTPMAIDTTGNGRIISRTGMES